MSTQPLAVAATVGSAALSRQPLTTVQVSEQTSIPAATLRYWRSAGIGPKSFKLGRVVRYRPEDVDAWMQAQYEATKVGDELVRS